MTGATNITTTDITATGTITGDVTGNLTGNVTGATNITTTNITATGTITGDLSGDVTANSITSTNITASGQLEISPTIATGNSDLNVTFLNISDQFRIGGSVKPFTFNPNSGIVKSYDMQLLNDLTVGGATSINSKQATTTNELCRILFLDGDSNVGTSYDIVRDDPLYYIPNSATLVTNNIRGQGQLISPLLVLLGYGFSSPNATIGLYDAGNSTIRNRYQHVGGHVFTDNSNNLIMTNTTQTRIYNELQCDDDVTITGTLTAGVLNIGTQTATNFSVTNNLSVGGDTILTNTPTASGSSPLDVLLIGSNKIQRGSITFNPLSNILSTTNMGLTGNLTSSSVTTTTLTSTTLNLSGDLTAGADVYLSNLSNITTLKTYELLVKDTADDAVKKTTGITTGVNLVGGEFFLSADEIKTDTIILNGLPLNYTETYNTDTWGIVANASFGGGSYILLPNNGTLKQYGSLLNPSGGIFGLKSASSEWGFTNSAYDGLYEIKISCYFQNNSTVRVVPRLNLYRWRSGSYSQQLQLHADSSYIRMAAGKVNSIGIGGKIHLTSVDTFRIPTLINNHGSTNFGSDQIAASLFDGTDFVISMTYLGNLTETITT